MRKLIITLATMVAAIAMLHAQKEDIRLKLQKKSKRNKNKKTKNP